MSVKEILKSIAKPFLPVCFKVFPELRCINNYRYTFWRMPNLINPKTFNEKILLKELFDRNPKLTLLQDKFLVRDFVKARLENGEQHLTKLYAVVDNPAKIRELDLPNQFVMKPNHLSGLVKIVHDSGMLKCGELEKHAEICLKKNYYFDYYEWAYKHIKPRIIFEELLEFEGHLPDDYKFFCFNGKPQFIQVDKGRFTKHQRNFYDLNFSLLPVRLDYENFQDNITAPKNFNNMIEIAKKLSKGTDFIRVDLYNINGRIVFGELTNYPCAGLKEFEPSSWDTKFGSYWKRW